MKIGKLTLKNSIWLAPMAGITNLPYRQIMKRFGASLVFTEMVSANGLIRDGRRTRELLASCDMERPLGIQLFGDDPEVLAEASRIVSQDGDLIDINMGCPVRKVVRSGAGSALLQSPEKIGRIVAAVRRATPLPLSVKIRSGWDLSSVNFLEVGRIAESEGADAVVLHPRTRCQGFGGLSNWDHIRQLKQALGIPVIGSGDIFLPEHALAMVEQTRCDGLMIGRGGYGNPWLIGAIEALLRGEHAPEAPSAADRHRTAVEHFDLYRHTFGERKAVLDMRKHLCWYSRGLAEASHFRSTVNQCQTAAELRQVMSDFFLAAEAEDCRS